MNCIIDGTVDEKYLSLGVWGKPVIYFPIANAIESACFENIFIVTKNSYIEYLVKEYFQDSVKIRTSFPEAGLLIDGRAVNISKNSIVESTEYLCGNILSNIFDYCNDPDEKILVNCRNNFELSLILCNKRNKSQWLRKMICDRIIEKELILRTNFVEEEICLVGHSQFDQWTINSLCGCKVRNCGISGITAREYIDDIINKDKINLDSDAVLILIGINDLVLDISVKEIANNILELVDTIITKTSARIYFFEILHINGRLDRNNDEINELNDKIYKRLPTRVKWLNTSTMNDPYGNLNYRYTKDGLHLNDAGYRALQNIIEREVSL